MANSFLIRLVLAAGLVVLPLLASAKAREVDDFYWTGVERVIAVGDIHGDYGQYMRTLQAAGLVDEKGRWAGGETHLVQTGDVPDRGPDTRRIMDHLEDLQKQARKKGGRVHTLIGNHDAMMIYGDLRYVTPAEFEAFATSSSGRIQNERWKEYLKAVKSQDPEGFDALNLEELREKFNQKYPLGWPKHRAAWAPRGEYGSRVLENPVVLKINDTLFLHGGLSAKYCAMDLEEITDTIHTQLRDYERYLPGMVEDDFGPLWYRGLAQDDEAERMAMVDAILERYAAQRIVVGHSPTQGIVWPRFNGKVVLNDVGMAAYYGGHMGFLELKGGEAIAHYPDDLSIPLPVDDDGRIAYLEQVIAQDPENGYLQARLRTMRSMDGTAVAPVDTANLSEEERAELAQQELWLSPDNCR